MVRAVKPWPVLCLLLLILGDHTFLWAGKKVVENDVNKRCRWGLVNQTKSNKTMQQDLHIFVKPITTHHSSSDSTWFHNTLALLISRNPQWLSCSVPGRRADWESFCRSLERSLDVNNKPNFGESKPKDHDILATVPAVPGYAYPRYPQDWGDTGFRIILDNGCSKNFLNPNNRSSNAKYDQSCSFDILFDIPKPSALNAFWVKTLAAFSKVAAATSTCNWKYFPQRALTQQGQFSFAWGGAPQKGFHVILLREVTSTKSKNDVHSTQVSSLASANAMPWYWPCRSQRHPKLNFKS